MKKILSAVVAGVLAVTMVACFAGCSKKAETKTEEKAVLTMATNATFPPYEYKEGEKVVGIDAEIAQAIADKLGMTLKIEDISFDSIITGVQTGKYDIGMAGMTVTDERKKSINFTDTYATGIQSIIVKSDSKIKTIDDLNGTDYKIGVQLSTTGDIYASAKVEDGGYGTERVTKFKSGTDAVAALLSGKIDCVIIDNEPAKSYVKANAGLKILNTEYTTEDYAICISKDNTELLGKVNTALKELKADGTVQKILDKYIKAN